MHGLNTIPGFSFLPSHVLPRWQIPPDQWLNQVSAKLPAEEAARCARAQASLLGNIVVAKPWAPRRGIMPSKGTYHGVWSWDAAFHAVGVSHWDIALAHEQVEIVLSGQQPNGMLPDLLRENGGVEASVTKPPVMAWAVAVVDRRVPRCRLAAWDLSEARPEHGVLARRTRREEGRVVPLRWQGCRLGMLRRFDPSRRWISFFQNG